MAKQKRNINLISPLGLLTLAGCGSDIPTLKIFNSLINGNNSSSNDTFSSIRGNAVKGPLENAKAFLDYNFDRILNGSETSSLTDANGGYTLTPTQADYQIVVITDNGTVDTSSGATMSGVTLTAPKGAAVITPMTTLMQEGGLTGAQVAAVLGLPDGVDPLTFNPYAVGVNAADALATEKAAQQVMSVVTAFAGAAEGAGASVGDAYAAAMKSVADVVKVKAEAAAADPTASDASTKIYFTKPEDLALIKDQVATLVATKAGIDQTTFDAMAESTATAIKNVNVKIEAITNTDLTDATSKNIFSNTQLLADQVQAGAAAEKVTVGSGAAKVTFTEKTKVDAAALNNQPTDVKLSNKSISEAATSLVIDTLRTVDADENDVFTYTLASGVGDSADFTIDVSTGVLSLIEKADYEAKASYAITVTSTDSGGKKTSKTFEVNVKNADDGVTTGTVTVTGTAMQGKTLTATHDLTDPDGVASVTFQWMADNVAISGARDSTYTLTAAELGKKITAQVAAKDNANISTPIFSDPTSKVASNPDIPLPDHFGSSFDWVYSDYQTYDGAVLAAVDRGGKLASITSAEEQLDLVAVGFATYQNTIDYNGGYWLDYVLPLNSTAQDGGGAVYAWLGANDVTTEGSFVWESGEDFNYENWGKEKAGSEEPDNSGGDQDGVAIAAGSWPSPSLYPDADVLGLQAQWNDISVDNALSYFVEFDTVAPSNAVMVVTINYANYAKWDAIEAEMDAAGDAFDISFDAMASRLDDTGDQAPLSNNGTTTSATSTALILKDDVTGSKLTAEFLNFVPSSITDLTTAFDNIDPALEETWVIDGGFRSITFTDANGTELWEIAHTDGTTTDAYTLTDFQAGTGEVNAIKLEGSTLSNQWADYMVLVDALDVADAAAATDDDALDALQAAAFGNFDLNKISIMAKGIAAPKLSLEFETDSVELTVLDVSLKLTAIGSTASTTFDIDAIQDLNNISGLVDATVKDVTDALSGAVGGSITFNHATHGELMDLTIENFADANKEIERIDLLPEGGLSAGLVNGDNYLMEEHGLIVTYFEGSNLTMSDFYSNVVFENKGFGDLLVPVAP